MLIKLILRNKNRNEADAMRYAKKEKALNRIR